MTGWGVERLVRAAHQSRRVRPTGGSTLMPPPSQGAERRREPHATRTGSRWGLRLFVVSGLAGAAWLLTGAAAHAADLDPVSRIGPALSEGGTTLVVEGILQAVDQPLDSDDHPSDPIRPTGGQPDVREHGALPHSWEYVPVARAARPEFHQRAANEPEAIQQPVRKAPQWAKPYQVRHHRVEPSVARHGKSVSYTRAERRVVRHHHSAVRADVPRTTQDDSPDGDVPPAPLQVQFETVSGSSATGLGTPLPGSSAAVLAVAVSAHSVASRRLLLATGVEARQEYAGAPAVQPD